jgi:hypothetical protein
VRGEKVKGLVRRSSEMFTEIEKKKKKKKKKKKRQAQTQTTGSFLQYGIILMGKSINDTFFELFFYPVMYGSWILDLELDFGSGVGFGHCWCWFWCWCLKTLTGSHYILFPF